MPRVTSRTPSVRVEVSATGVRVSRRPDTVTVEEPLQIRVAGRPLSVTMRTPGADFDLVIGFLLTEGLIGAADDVATLMHCQDAGEDGAPTYNVVDVVLRPDVAVPEVSLERYFPSTSACGVCGKASVEDVRARSRYEVRTDHTPLAPDTLMGLPGALKAQQKVFGRTGGLHAAGLFTTDGELLAIREDIGRHNAVDKLIGWAAREDLVPLRGCVLMVSARASFELTQKALMAGIPCLAAISAPSSLAVRLAAESGMTLVGFLRPPRMSVYAGAERLGL